MKSDGGKEIFSPDRIKIELGDTVHWVLSSGFHSATAYHPSINDRELRIPTFADPWDSSLLRRDGEVFEHTFTVEGAYNYYCVPHESLGMLGIIVVGEISEQEPALNKPEDSLPIAARGKINEFNKWARRLS